MSSADLTDERFENIVRQLRAARPVAPEALRERVAALAVVQPVQARRRLPFSLRRAALVLVPACLVLSAAAAAVHGLVAGTSGDRAKTAHRQPTTAAAAAKAGTPPRALDAIPLVIPETPRRAGGTGRPAPLPVTKMRYQDYQAAMRLRVDGVDDLSRVTTRAIRTTRRLGGYVVTVDYDTPGRATGYAFLRVRAPTRNVQEAILRFSELGTIVAQDVRIRDLQERVDTLAGRIAKLRLQIERIDAELRDPALPADERERLERRRAALERLLRGSARARASTIRRARLATVTLTLTTAKPADEEAAPPGRIERALDDAGSILVKELAWALYVLIVAAPFVLLLLLAVAGARYATRRADQRLLKTAST